MFLKYLAEWKSCLKVRSICKIITLHGSLDGRFSGTKAEIIQKHFVVHLIYEFTKTKKTKPKRKRIFTCMLNHLTDNGQRLILIFETPSKTLQAILHETVTCCSIRKLNGNAQDVSIPLSLILDWTKDIGRQFFIFFFHIA